MNRWVAGCIIAAIVVLVAVAVILFHDRPPYNHVLTSVERIDEDEDALRVFHDKVRGVTCYQAYGVVGAMSCIPDVWLSPYHNASADASSP